MTEKEIAEKVWEVIDARVAQLKKWKSESEIPKVIDEYVVEIEALLGLANRIIKVLPRPKKKVKKTREVWLLVGFDNRLNTLRTDGNIYSTREEAEEAREEWEIIQRVDISMEVEE